MAITINGGSTMTYFEGWDSFQNPMATATQYTTTSGGITVVNTIKDATKTELTTLNAILNNTVFCNQSITGFTNITPTICNTIGFPNVVSLQDGVGKVNLSTANGDLQIQLKCDVDTTVGTAYLSAYTSGSMAKTMHDLIVGAVNGRTPPQASFMNLYSSGYTRNDNLYTKNIIDTSPFTDNGYAFGASLISPRHIVFATHCSPGVNSYITFTRADGSTTTKQILVVSRNLNGYGSDIGIGYLDSAVTGITPYSVLPNYASTSTKLPIAVKKNTPENQSISEYEPLPMGMYGFYAKVRYPFGGGDNIRQMQLGNYSGITGTAEVQFPQTAGFIAGVTSGYSIISDSRDIRYPYNRWWTQLAGGDSGSPGLLPTGLTTATGTPLTILLGHTLLNIEAISYYIPQVNATMNAIKSGGDTTVYALDQINVSQSAWWNSFTSY
jgi:hypothetical protein